MCIGGHGPHDTPLHVYRMTHLHCTASLVGLRHEGDRHLAAAGGGEVAGLREAGGAGAKGEAGQG